MAVSAVERRSPTYLGNGVATEFAFGFKILAETDLDVRQIDASGFSTTLTLTTDYTVSGVGADGGGVVTLLVPPPTGESVIILGNQSFAQPLVLVNQGPYFAVDVMRALDRITILTQQLNERLGRAVVVPPEADVADLETLIGGILALAPVASAITAVAGFTSEIDTVAGIAADVTTVAGVETEVQLLAALNAELVALGAIVGDISAVAAVDTAVARVAQKYQGAAAADPSVRALDGSALEVGDFYLNTVTDDIRFVTSTGPVVWSELATLIDESTLTALGVTITPEEINIGAQRAEDRIINGTFAVWQRANSFGGSGYGGVDRWKNLIVGGTVVQSRQLFNPEAAFGQNRPTFRLRQTVSGQSLAGHLAATQQRIEDVRSYSGQTITVLGFARRNSGAGNIALEMLQDFGSGGSPSADVVGIGVQQIALTANWEPFAAVVTVPDLTGKTIGTNGDSSLDLTFWSSAGADWAARSAALGIQTIGVELWGIHIRVGTFDASAAFDYVAPNFIEDFEQCLRYYRTGYIFFSGDVTTPGIYFHRHTLSPPMRGTPTIVGTNVFASGFPAAVGTLTGSPEAIVENRTCNSTTNAGRFQTSLTLDAEL